MLENGTRDEACLSLRYECIEWSWNAHDKPHWAPVVALSMGIVLRCCDSEHGSHPQPHTSSTTEMGSCQQAAFGFPGATGIFGDFILPLAGS
jgi:hypothetical protein